jgi:glycosyltransferase involved in cell wall biosynthesis
MNSESNKQNKPLKVLFLTHNYIRFKGDFSGVFLHLLARKLRDFGIEVIVIAPHDSHTDEYEEIDGVKIYRFRYATDDNETFAYRGDMHRQLFRNPFRIFRLISFIKASYRLALTVIEKEKIGVVSIQWLIPNGITGFFLKRRLKEKITLYLSSHGTDIRLLTKLPLVYSIFRPVIKKTKCWTVVSNYLKDLILGKDSRNADKIRVIPMPNDETLFCPNPEISKEPYLVVAVSRLMVQKRLYLLLEAIKIVSEKIPEIRLEIYGAGPERVTLTDLIVSSGLEGRAKICQPVPQEELSRIYNRAAVVVLNSINEGFGLALTEAMLCRTAVIGTISGGITDIMEDNKSGLLVPADNTEALAEAIEKIIGDTVLREKLAEDGYRRAIAKYSSESSARQYAELFRGL